MDAPREGGRSSGRAFVISLDGFELYYVTDADEIISAVAAQENPAAADGPPVHRPGEKGSAES